MKLDTSGKELRVSGRRVYGRDDRFGWRRGSIGGLRPLGVAAQVQGLLVIPPPLEAVGGLVGAGGGPVAVVRVVLSAGLGRSGRVAQPADRPVADVSNVGQDGAQQYNQAHHPYEPPLSGLAHG